MKYVVAWESRPSASEDALDRSLQLFGKWSRTEGSNFLEFLRRVAAVASPSLRRRTSHRSRVTWRSSTFSSTSTSIPSWTWSPPGSLARRSSSVAALDSALARLRACIGSYLFSGSPRPPRVLQVQDRVHQCSRRGTSTTNRSQTLPFATRARHPAASQGCLSAGQQAFMESNVAHGSSPRWQLLFR
jgi:hypothetical protein